MKEFLKIAAFFQFLAIMVYGVVWVVFQLNGDKMPLTNLPICLVLVLFVTILAALIDPILEWWMS